MSEDGIGGTDKTKLGPWTYLTDEGFQPQVPTVTEAMQRAGMFLLRDKYHEAWIHATYGTLTDVFLAMYAAMPEHCKHDWEFSTRCKICGTSQ